MGELFFCFKANPQERAIKDRLFITTAIGLMLGTGAFAQSPSEQPRTNSPPAAQSHTNSNSSAPAGASSQPSSRSTPPAQNAQSTPSGTPNSATTTSTTGNNDSSRSQA